MSQEQNVLIRGFLTNPLLLENLDAKDIEALNEMFPFSVGMEIETKPKDIPSARKAFKDLGLMDLDLNPYEQRFRFKPGFEGAKQVYRTCKMLKEFMYFNTGSGIHYHIDFTDVWEDINREELKGQTWILDELDSWNYKGSYNKRAFGSSSVWVRWNPIRTLEFRIGNMTFDYREMMRCMLSAQSISIRVKNILSGNNAKLLNLQEKMRKLNEQISEEKINKEEIIKKRVITIG